MKKHIIALIVFILPIFSFGEGETWVSVIKLIVDPQEYVGKRVYVSGYFDMGIFSALYPIKEYALHGDNRTYIRLVDASGDGSMTLQCSGKYVSFSGLVINKRHQYMISDIDEVFDVDNNKVCWARRKKISDPEK